MRRALLPVLLAVTACSTEVSEPAERPARAGRIAQGIVNGVPDTAGSNAVVFILINGSKENFCTGTLIAPNLVLTARHCIAEIGESGECGTFTTQMAPSSLSIAVGVSPGAPVATATKIIVDSSKANSGCSNDIALFQLDRNVTGAAVSRVRLSKSNVGEEARTAGYGDNGSGTPTNGRFVRTGLSVDSVGPASYTYKTKTGQSLPVDVPVGEIVTGESTCFGDSGGPLFDAAGNVIGVTSRGIDESCIDRPSIYSDTASHAPMITAAALAAGHPLKPAAPLPGSGPAPGDADPDDAATDEEADEEEEDGMDESETDEATPAKKKKKRTLAQAPAAACSAATQRAPSPSLPLTLACSTLLAALVARRRSRAAS